MLEVFILKIENPGCFWVGIKRGGKFIHDETEYRKLQTEMNQFYNKNYRYVDEIKPSVLEEEQVCAVYCQELKSWCRAVVKSIRSCADYYLTECFLVDYAQIISVKTDRICVALESFMRLPYRAKKFKLYCTKPVTLHVNYFNNKVETVPVDRWDIAATQYFRNLLNVTSQVEAKLCDFEEDSFDVYIYVTIKGEKVCVNDDLVAKNFACYEMDMKSCSYVENYNEKILSLESVSDKISPACVLWPTLLQARKPKAFETSGDASDGCQSIPFKPSEESDSYNTDVMVTIPPLAQGVTISAQEDLPTDKKTTEMQPMEKDLCEKNLGVKLLQFLNPDPLKAVDQDKTEKLLSFSPSCPVVLSNKIEPCSSLDVAPLFQTLKKELLKKQFQGPNHTQSYSWPAIARGCDSVIISPEKDPLVYLLPVITFLQSRSCYISLPARNGPVALILCPGQKKAGQVFELLKSYSYCSRPLHPILLLLGKKKEEIKSVRIPRGCEIIVTTSHSLLRLLEYQQLLFLRICHLVLDEVDVLFSEDSNQENIVKILEYYKTNLNVEERESAPQQIVAVGTYWNKNIDYLMKEFMNDPYVVITSLEEAAIYGKVQQVVRLCPECNRISALLQMLDFTPVDVQKTLIFTSSVEEMEVVHKAVESSSIFCLKMNSEIGFDFGNVVDQWNKKFNSGTNVVLVLTDDYTTVLGITDATCVIHFSFPASPKIFGARLYSMSANFQNSIKKVLSGKEQQQAKSILLLTECNARHAVGVLHYLKRAEANIPPELFDLTSGVLEAIEESKSDRALCHYVKAHGFCKKRKCCPDRHQISLQTDLPEKGSDVALPTAGYITILPLFIVDATTYLGRIIGKQKDAYIALAEAMNLYYKKTSNRISADTVEKLAMYALQEENAFHRVQVLEVMPKEGNSLFHSVHVKYMDEGRSAQVQNYHLLLLPEPFKVLCPQAVEFIVCRVKPPDNEVEWNPKVTRYIDHKIRGKPHEAKIVFALKNTVWLDPVVRVTKLPDLKTSINEYNIRSEILSTGLGVDNPNHIHELQKLFSDAHKKGELPSLTHPLNYEKAAPISESILDCFINASDTTEEQVPFSEQSGPEGDALTVYSHSQVPLKNHCNESKKADESLQPSSKRFHPTIKWFEKQDIVVLKIKLQNIISYDCKIFTQQIIFSASAEGKFYLADMELQGSILKEKSACVLKNEEPVITLTKEKTGLWYNLLKHKNPHVSIDFDYLEDSEEKSSIFVDIAHKKIRQCTTVVCEEELESLDESDTDSDLSSC